MNVTDLHLPQSPRKRATRFGRTLRRLTREILSTAGLATLLLAAPAFAQKPAPDTYEAALTGVSATGITLKIEVLNWSDDAGRAAVVDALGAGADLPKELDKLPSVGAVWQSGSAVGHSVKYAHRVTEADGSQRITLVTTKPLDSYSFKPWTLTSGTAAPQIPYGVLELKLDGKGTGTGTLSLAAEVAVDATAHTVSLKTGAGTPTLLTGVKLMPKPYWASR
ncbi:MAG TPA: hypothetical protein VHH11_08680 [Gammaproteobacteria bacterium]|jgi:hypothetical protein|nr:hypothetical protein [Gammaproteobacteria bacterium]